MRKAINGARPAVVVFGAVTLGIVGLAAAGGAPVWVAAVCAAAFWLV